MCGTWNAAVQGSRRRRLALEVFVYQVKKTIGAYAAAMGGLEAVAFTGGIGENSAAAARGVLRRAGVSGDSNSMPCATRRGRSETGWSRRTNRKVTVLALATNEELMVARRAYKLLA